MVAEDVLGMRDDRKRNFALIYEGQETEQVYAGATPRHAALQAAREVLEPAESYDAVRTEPEQHSAELGLYDGSRVHVYDAWAWTEKPAESRPGWLGDTVRDSDVTKKGIVPYQEYQER